MVATAADDHQVRSRSKYKSGDKDGDSDGEVAAEYGQPLHCPTNFML